MRDRRSHALPTATLVRAAPDQRRRAIAARDWPQRPRGTGTGRADPRTLAAATIRHTSTAAASLTASRTRLTARTAAWLRPARGADRSRCRGCTLADCCARSSTAGSDDRDARDALAKDATLPRARRDARRLTLRRGDVRRRSCDCLGSRRLEPSPTATLEPCHARPARRETERRSAGPLDGGARPARATARARLRLRADRGRGGLAVLEEDHRRDRHDPVALRELRAPRRCSPSRASARRRAPRRSGRAPARPRGTGRTTRPRSRRSPASRSRDLLPRRSLRLLRLPFGSSFRLS